MDSKELKIKVPVIFLQMKDLIFLVKRSKRKFQYSEIED